MFATASLVAASLLLAGCTHATSADKHSPSVTPPPKPMVVATTDQLTTLDPAAAVTASDQLVAHALFQRLMTLDPATGKLLPDAAEDCTFTGPMQYDCRLRQELAFHDGRPVLASDVVFSIQRALRLDAPGTAVRSLASVANIETRDDRTVRLQLRWPDSQIGAALSAATFSIVDPKSYDPDSIRPMDQKPLGTGSFESGIEANGVRVLTRYEKYHGAFPAGAPLIHLRRFPGSAEVEEAMQAHQIDVAWRALSTAAAARVKAQTEASEDNVSESGFRRVLPGNSVRILNWQRDSQHRNNPMLRAQVAAVLQQERTTASLLPGSVAGGLANFPMGGKSDPVKAPPGRTNLTMAYDNSIAAETDAAHLLRDRLEASGALSVRLVPVSTGRQDADLRLSTGETFVATPLGYLTSYVAAPLAESEAKVAELAQKARTPGSDDSAHTALADLQKQAAIDLTVLPVSPQAEVLYVASDVKLDDHRYGPGWQPLLSALRR